MAHTAVFEQQTHVGTPPRLAACVGSMNTSALAPNAFSSNAFSSAALSASALSSILSAAPARALEDRVVPEVASVEM